MSKQELHAVLERVIDRNTSQKALRIAQMREELIDLGYSIVTTEWLNAVIKDSDPMVAVRRRVIE